MEAFVCPNCNKPNLAMGRFCTGCGVSLITKCPRCEVENPVGAKFCGGCSIELTKATPILGLPLSRVKVWRKAFDSIGWLPSDAEETELLHSWNSMAEELNIAPIDPDREPTVFVAPIKGNIKWGFKEGIVNTSILRAWKTNDGVVWATSYRLLGSGKQYGLLSGGRMHYFVLPYETMMHQVVKGGILPHVKLRGQDIFQVMLSLRLPRGGMFDWAMVLAATDPVVKLSAGAKIASDTAVAEGFLEVLREFFAEAAELARIA